MQPCVVLGGIAEKKKKKNKKKEKKVSCLFSS